MSILIKGMEMPKNCDDCCLRQQNEGFVGYCGITKTLDVRSFEKDKLSNCPLIKIPPHGRLIDADAIETELWSVRRGYQLIDDTQTADKIMTGIFRVERLLKEAPVVIEAEE